MTHKERYRIYQRFFHRINVCMISGKNEKLTVALHLIDSWSYAHRRGNGELSEYEQQKCIDHVVKKMEEF